MGLAELFLVAVGLSMDAFAVAICKGLALQKASGKSMALVGLWFGGFQALMPVLGYLVGVQFREALAPKAMVLLALATSIDALAVGVGFAFLSVNITAAAGFIGGVTFVLSAAGVKVGSVFGARYKARAELVGGVILILLGTKILLEHLGVL